MAHVTFLIGNGFDLNLGLNTRFKDVYPFYLEQESKSENIEHFKMTIADSKGTEKWADFEMAMATYAKTFNNENELIECLTDFRKVLKTYLIQEQKKFLTSFSEDFASNLDVKKETLRSITSFCHGLSNNITRKFTTSITAIDFITFNYTTILDSLLEAVSSNLMYINTTTNLLHIHGSLNETPVLGIDNITQLTTSYKITKKAERAMIKPIFNKEFDNIRIEKAQNMIDSADCLCIFGLSLGDSDLTWRTSIKEWLQQSRYHHLFFYIPELINQIDLDDYEKLDLEDTKKEDLSKYLQIDSNENLLSQLHLPCGNKIFNYQSIIKNLKRKDVKKK